MTRDIHDIILHPSDSVLVAQGLEGLPVIEEKRPKIETVSRCVFWQSYKIFYFDSNLTLLCFAVCETTDILMC